MPELALDQLPIAQLVALLAGDAMAEAGCGRSAVELADLVGLSRASGADLGSRLALEPRAAMRVAAAFALGRRVERAARPARPKVTSAEDVFRLLASDFRGLERETFHVLLLDGKHALRRAEVVSVGSLTSSIVHPREVLRAAVQEAAAAFVCAHNHPSGDPEPSAEDVEVTKRLASAGKVVGIPLLDHVVVGDGRYVSLRERVSW